MEEYYPTPEEILVEMADHVIMVGSMTCKDPEACKDVDFVVSPQGAKLLEKWSRWLVKDGPHCLNWIPYHYHGFQKSIDFFTGIFDTYDESKWADRVTYEEAASRDLKIVDFLGIQIRALQFAG